MNTLPLLYFPTNTVILDDERSFLEHLEVGLDGDIGESQFFSNPEEALRFIEQNGISSLGQEDGIQFEEDDDKSEKCVLSIQIQNLHNRIRDQNRYNQVSTVVVDYQMGDMNGIEWCKQITNPFVQKILLTGAADEQIGIEALNHGWIDQYVRKQDANMLEKVITAIKRAQRKCFSKLTQGLHFAITQQTEDTALADNRFANYFFSQIDSKNVSEFYLTEAMGCFLLVGQDSKQHLWFTQTRSKAESNLQLVEHWIESEKIKNNLETFKQIICCPAPQNFVTPESANYEPYLFSAQRVEGQQTYYCAMTPNLIG